VNTKIAYELGCKAAVEQITTSDAERIKNMEYTHRLQKYYEATGKIPEWHIENELKYVHPSRHPRLREIAEKHPEWFHDYGRLSDIEVQGYPKTKAPQGEW
jgi:hypothetical protein